MANDYYDNSTPAERFQPGTTARGSEVDDKFDDVQAGFAKLPGVAATGKGFDEPIHVGNATSDTHAVPLGQALDKVAEWVNASLYDGSTEYSFSDVVIGSDGLTYRFVGSSPATGDDPVTSNTGNWSAYGGGGSATLGTLTASMTNGQTTTINLSDEIVTPIVTATREVVDAGLTNSDWDVDATGTNYEIEDTAYPTSVTPSGTTGTITLTLGAGQFEADDVGKRVVGNGGEAVVTATDGTASVNVAFASTATIASGDWQFYALDKKNVISLADYVASVIEDVVFEAAATDAISVSALSNDSAFIAYQDEGNSDRGTFTIYDNERNQLVPPTVFETGATTNISAATTADDRTLIAYTDNGNSSHGTLVIYDASGNQVIGPTVFKAASTNGTELVSATTLSANRVAIAYGSGAQLYLKVYDSAGTETLAETSVDANGRSNISATTLSSDNIAIAYAGSGTSAYPTLAIYTAAGAQVLAPTTIESVTVGSGDLSATTLADDKILIAYRRSSDNAGRFAIYSSTGTQLVAPTTFDAGATDISATTLSNGNGLIAFRDISNSNHGTFVAYDPSGVQVIAPTVFEARYARSISTDTLSTGNIVTAYSDFDTSSHGFYGVYQPDGTQVAIPVYTYFSGHHAAAITNATGQIDTQFWTDINSLTVAETLNGQSAHYAISTDNRATWQIAIPGSSSRNIARNNAGTWQYNADNAYGAESWFDATPNTEFGALQQAMDTTQNRMTGTQASGLSDAEIPAAGNTLDLAIILFTSDSSVTPTSDGMSINYDANARDFLATPGTDYEWDHPDLTTVRFTSLGNFNIKARVL